jgi:hypothetical protein
MVGWEGIGASLLGLADNKIMNKDDTPCSVGGVEQHTTNDDVIDASCCLPIEDGPSPSVSTVECLYVFFAFIHLIAN